MGINVNSLKADFVKAIRDLGKIGLWPVDIDGVRHDAGSVEKDTESLFTEEKCITISGKMKVGKSSLLNALLFDGRNVMPTDPTPETVKLTFIHYAEPSEERFRVVFYNKDEWEEAKNAYCNDPGVKQAFEEQCAHSAKLGALAGEWIGHPDVESSDYGRLCEYTSGYDSSKKDSNRGKYTPYVKCVHLFKHSPKLYATMVVDTPGTADPNPVNSLETRKWIGKAICVIYVCQSDKPLGRDQEEFFSQYLKGVPKRHLAIVRNMFDLLLADEYGKNWTPDDALHMADVVKQEIKEKLCSRENVFPYSAKLVEDPRLVGFVDSLDKFCSQFFGSEVTLKDRFERAVGQLGTLVAAGKDRWEQDKARLEDEVRKFDLNKEEIEKQIKELKERKEEWKDEVQKFDTFSVDIDRRIEQTESDVKEEPSGLVFKVAMKIRETIDGYSNCEEMRVRYRTDCARILDAMTWKFVAERREFFRNYCSGTVGEAFRDSLVALYNRFSDENSAKKARNVKRFQVQFENLPKRPELGERSSWDYFEHNIDLVLARLWSRIVDWADNAAIRGEVKEELGKVYDPYLKNDFLESCKKPYENLKKFIKDEIARFEDMKAQDLESAERVLDAKKNDESEAKAKYETEEKLKAIKKQLEDLGTWGKEWDKTVEALSLEIG